MRGGLSFFSGNIKLNYWEKNKGMMRIGKTREYYDNRLFFVKIETPWWLYIRFLGGGLLFFSLNLMLNNKKKKICRNDKVFKKYGNTMKIDFFVKIETP